MSESVKDWLRTKRVSSWGEGWDLNDEKELAQAAEWFDGQMSQYLRHLITTAPMVTIDTLAAERQLRRAAAEPRFPGSWPPPRFQDIKAIDFNGRNNT